MDNLDGLILSAGYSGRMKGFKPLMKYEGKPFLLSIILKLSKICRKIVVVTGYRAEDIRDEIHRCLERQPVQNWLDCAGITTQQWTGISSRLQFVFNPDYELGMFASLQTGFKWMNDSQWILYHFVDQPHIPAAFYPEFAAQIDSDYTWVQPQFKGRKGHPVVMHQSMQDIILQAPPTTGLKSILNHQSVRKKFWECGYKEILEDFDTEMDLYQLGDMDESL